MSGTTKFEVLVLMNDSIFNRTIGSILKENGVTYMIEEDTVPAIIRPTFEHYEPSITLIGGYLGKKRVLENDVWNFKIMLNHYHQFYKTRIPVLMIYHEQDTEVHPSEELQKIIYTMEIPAGLKTSDVSKMLMEKLKLIDNDRGIGLGIFAQSESSQKEEPTTKYSEKDFSVEYPMDQHMVVLSGPLIGRAFSRIEMLLKNEKIYQDVKMTAPRDKDTKRILRVDWQGIIFISEKAEHYTFIVFKDLIKNGIYERIQFLNFKEKEPLFTNKIHFELYVNRFCEEI